jgi:hypothetical protein
MTKAADLADLRLDADGFNFRGDHYLFSDIAHIRFARMNVTTYMVPVKLGTEGSACLLLELRSGEQIKLVEKPGWFLTSNQTRLNGIVDLFSYLAQATFKSRLADYLSAAEQRGYFVYSGYKFYPTRKVIASEGREFTSENTDFMQAYNYIELRPKNYGVLHRLKRELSWSSKITAVDTLTDTDVIFAILDHFYDLRWA